MKEFKTGILIAIIIILLLECPKLFASESIDSKIIKLWGEQNGKEVIYQCDKYAKFPNHCKKIHSAIASAESNFGKNARNHNIYGNSKYKFKTDKEAIIKFNKTYLKYYWKPTYKPSDFYRPVGYGRAHYCTSEDSSGTANGCPFGYLHATRTFNYLSN